jgi:PAS domain S-box-containing protein
LGEGVDGSLVEHLKRIDAYARGIGLVDPRLDRKGLRRKLADAIPRLAPQILDPWMRDLVAALHFPPEDWERIKQDQLAAVCRWARHIGNPSDIDTYRYLREHARQGFIAQFPASRFLSAQMRFAEMLAGAMRAERPADPDPELDDLLALLEQERRVRVLHIADFFVEGREQLLLQQEASYRRAIDNAPAAIVIVDHTDGIVVFANDVSSRVLHADRSALEGMPVTELFPEPERPLVRDLCAAARAAGHAHRDDLHLRRLDGELMPVFANAGFIDYGDRHRVLLVCVDISERQLLESQLIQSEKMAAIGQLAAGIAHELRNPLAIVMNALYDLRQVLGSNDGEVTEDLNIAEEEIARAQAIINNLLEFSRESGADLERVDVNDVLTRTVQLMHKYLENHGVEVDVALGPIAACVVNANAMRQIMLNLVTNAVQAMPNGGRLGLRTHQLAGNRIELEVCDTGVGIPAHRLKDIFNPFYTTQAPGQGTGLGLSVVHSILERYRGTIHVTSEVGVGTTFRIELPCPCHDDAGNGV